MKKTTSLQRPGKMLFLCPGALQVWKVRPRKNARSQTPELISLQMMASLVEVFLFHCSPWCFCWASRRVLSDISAQGLGTSSPLSKAFDDCRGTVCEHGLHPCLTGRGGCWASITLRSSGMQFCLGLVCLGKDQSVWLSVCFPHSKSI